MYKVKAPGILDSFQSALGDSKGWADAPSITNKVPGFIIERRADDYPNISY
jgi:hypothetical protein